MTKFSHAIVIFVSILVMVSPSQAAFFRRKLSGNTADEKQKVLSKSQRKGIAASLVKDMLNQQFIKDNELPYRYALAEINVIGDGIGVSNEQFTDLVLNQILEQPKVLIVNQDLKIDLSMDYKLMDYADAYNVRKDGVLMGADYYITGRIESVPTQSDSGKIKYNYLASLVVHDIRTNKTIFETSYDHSQKHKTRRRRSK